jgi:hypothetical protein
MIQISLAMAIVFYGIIILIGFMFLYILSELRAKNVYRVLEKQFLWRCAFCGFLYFDEGAATLSECPRCGSYNTIADAQDRSVGKSRHLLVAAEAEISEEEDTSQPRRNSARRKRPGQKRRGPRKRR